jgi:thymidylate kinase
MRQHNPSVAVEGPPGSGKTTHCRRAFRWLSGGHPTVALPELLVADYNCGESDRLHDLQSLHKERLAAALSEDGFAVVMDRCRISTMIMRMTQQGGVFEIALYREIEQRIFGDSRLAVGRLVLLQADAALCAARRRPLLGHEPTVDLDSVFYRNLHDHYTHFGEAAHMLYPDVVIERINTGAD